MGVDALLLLLTFALGGVLSRVSLCAVGGMQQLVAGRDHTGLRRLLLAASAAGTVLLLLACVVPERVLLPGNVPFRPGIITGGLLLFAGAVAGARLQGRFSLQRPAWPRAARCLAGGVVMGYGAVQVPGGNDMLLLWAIPGLTLYGIVAYASMLLAIAAGLCAAAAWPRKPAPGTVN